MPTSPPPKILVVFAKWPIHLSGEPQKGLGVFRFWYNHVRPHQHLDGPTPAQHWNGKGLTRSKEASYFSAWDELLTGFYFPSWRPATTATGATGEYRSRLWAAWTTTPCLNSLEGGDQSRDRTAEGPRSNNQPDPAPRYRPQIPGALLRTVRSGQPSGLLQNRKRIWTCFVPRCPVPQ